MALPSRPIRKAAQVGVNVQGKPVPGANKAAYTRRSAQPFGAGPSDAHKRQPAPVSPQSMPVNDKDGGDALHTGPEHADKRGV